jgi:hypothetical protein
MSVNLSPIGGAGWQFFDNNGIPLAGGKLYAYLAGTTTPETTYTTNAGNIAWTHPITLDSAGRVPSGGEIWLTSGVSYKFLLKTASPEVQIWSADNISGINDFANLTPVIYNATGDGSTVVFALASAPTSENTTNVYINGVYQQKNTYSISSITLTFSTAPPITSLIEVSYF